MFKYILIIFVSIFASCAQSAVAFTPSAPILVLGDSLSSAHHISIDSGWVRLLETRLQAAGSQRSVVNASISGETTAGGLARLPKLLADIKPALVIVELGANDGLRGLQLAEIRTNLETMLGEIRQTGAHILIAGIELPLNYGTPYRAGLRKMYRDLAQEFNAQLLPFLLDGVALNPDLMQDDGLHPQAAGEPRVLDNVWTVLEPMLKTLR